MTAATACSKVTRRPRSAAAPDALLVAQAEVRAFGIALNRVDVEPLHRVGTRAEPALRLVRVTRRVEAFTEVDPMFAHRLQPNLRRRSAHSPCARGPRTQDTNRRTRRQSDGRCASRAGGPSRQPTPTAVSMLRTPPSFRPLVLAATVVAALALSPVGATPARAQGSRFSVEITKIEVPDKRMTFKASMGQQTMRVAPGVVLDGYKPGDKVLITFGQDGTESVISSIELVKS